MGFYITKKDTQHLSIRSAFRLWACATPTSPSSQASISIAASEQGTKAEDVSKTVCRFDESNNKLQFQQATYGMWLALTCSSIVDFVTP